MDTVSVEHPPAFDGQHRRGLQGVTADRDKCHATGPALLPQHAQLINESAISSEVASARGYRSVTTKVELTNLGFAAKQARVPALLIPIHGVSGDIVSYQIRPDEPRIIDGKAIKYESPKGGGQRIDVPPNTRRSLADPNVPLFVTEGVRKADAAASRGLCCVGLSGVWGFRGTNDQGGKVALADWESIALNGRKVYIVFDSDVMEKPQVHAALARLKALLKGRGAVVLAIYLPAGDAGAKTGLDDFFAQEKTVDDLLALASPDLRASTAYDDNDDETQTHSEVLLKIASAAELFRAPDGAPYATFPVDDHWETAPVRTRKSADGFRRWLRRRYFDVRKKGVSATAEEDALRTIEAQADTAPIHTVFTRIGEFDGVIYIDLGDDSWAAVEIDANGWSINHRPPAKFRRPANMAPLAHPKRGGTIKDLRQFLNVETDQDWILFVSVVPPRFPYSSGR